MRCTKPTIACFRRATYRVAEAKLAEPSSPKFFALSALSAAEMVNLGHSLLARLRYPGLAWILFAARGAVVKK
jgi:hypothetical protein